MAVKGGTLILDVVTDKAGLSTGLKAGLTAGAAALGGFLAYSVKTATDFDTTMREMGAVAQVPAAELKKLGDVAMEQGARTVFSANESAAAELELAKAGLSTADIMSGALANSLDLAAAGKLELADAATITANAMNTFGLSGARSKEVVDALAGAANASAADVSDLALALSQSGLAANAAGLSVQETTAALAAFADAGLKGSDAGTSLKTFLLNLVPTSDKAQAMMDKLGLSFTDAQGRMLPLSAIAEQLQTKLGGLSDAQQQAALKTIFGTDAYRAALVIMRQGAEGIEEYIDATSKVGNAQEVATARMAGFQGTIERLKGVFETTALKVGRELVPMLKQLGDWVAKHGDQIAQTVVGTVKFIADMFRGLFLGENSFFGRIWHDMKWIGARIVDIVDFIKGAVKTVGNALYAMFVKPIKAIIGWIGKLIGWIGKALDMLSKLKPGQFAGDLAKSTAGDILDAARDSGVVPGLARGGWVEKTGLAIVHEGEEYSGVGRELGGGGTVVLMLDDGTKFNAHVRHLARDEDIKHDQWRELTG